MKKNKILSLIVFFIILMNIVISGDLNTNSVLNKYSENNTISINQKTYEIVCNNKIGDICSNVQILKNSTYKEYYKSDGKCRVDIINQTGEYCYKDILYVYVERYEYQCIKGVIDCEYTGQIKLNNITITHDNNYFCGVDNKGIICDEWKDSSGGQGDGNGDGICQAGETCIRV